MNPLDRREFLVASAAVAATTAVPSMRAPRARRSIKKALKFGMVDGEMSLLEKFKLIKSTGFDGVEMDSPTELSMDEILEAKGKSKLEIPGVVDSVHWKSALSDPDASVRATGRKALETALRDCKKLGGTSVLLVPAVVNKKVSYQEAWDRSIAEIREVLPLAKELEIHIAIENVWNQFLLSPLEAARYVDQFESPWIGWHFDIGNVVNYGWPEQWIRTLGKRILKLDVKEYSRKKRDELGLWKGFDVEIGEGDCDWAAVMTALDEIGYSGWAAAEVDGGGRGRLADIAKRMDHCIAL
jgi:hexulose-6-phosphate isomerase